MLRVYELLAMNIGAFKVKIVNSQENETLCDERYGYGGDGRTKYAYSIVKNIDFMPEAHLLCIFI